MGKYPNVDKNFVRGSPPFLILKDKSGKGQEKMSIDSWSVDDIEEYVSRHVE
eukprot:CAMPEP_0113895422 /NCGR_PEP_ID=MMETSP0780_2-20120614/17354_1 /TAXON_ID=652834 /ORGANISM="Palpitomonas bilix" /LENGTH=51 /DNA_ID=CAMNT_0000886251 /DNA_START=386 /DNA_END=541 /DNA_ORIENTATION=+ /assembly_acc=CAM_ASM_000599